MKEAVIRDSPIARKLSAYVNLSEHELSILSGAQGHKRCFLIGSSIIRQGEVGQCAYIVTSGWALTYKELSRGTRQILEVRIPGDFLGLHSIMFRSADHNVEPITTLHAFELHARDLRVAFTRAPGLGAAIFWSALRDEAVMVEHLVRVGRRSATERIAHFLLELWCRLRLVGLGHETGFACPLSQYHLADTLGLSAVHVNRVLRDLREAGLMIFHKGQVEFLDLDAIISFADFDAAYLDHGSGTGRP